MRIRIKISYSAFVRNMTILELFCQTILYCYGKIMLTESIENPVVYPKKTVEEFEEFLCSDLHLFFHKLQIINNTSEMQNRL